MFATEDVTESRLLLAEYDRIKEEQKTRIGFRDNLSWPYGFVLKNAAA
ncbi:hypothetical protein [Streptomyces violaceusniger]